MNISLINNYQMYFGMPASYQMEGLISFYSYLEIFLIATLFFVSTLLFMVIILHIDGAGHLWTFYGSSSLKEFLNWLLFVRTWTHSTILELIWMINPTTILLIIVIPSFILFYALDEIIDAQAVIKIMMVQWYWECKYSIILLEILTYYQNFILTYILFLLKY